MTKSSRTARQNGFRAGAVVAVMAALFAPFTTPAQSPHQCRPPVQEEDSARGIHAYYQGNYEKFADSARYSFGLAYVSAFSFDIPWKLIEPEPGKYDWHLIDEALALAAKYNKKICLGLQVNWWAPDWVKERCPFEARSEDVA